MLAPNDGSKIPRHLVGYLFLAGLFLSALVACNLLVYKFFAWTLVLPDWIPGLGGRSMAFFGLSVGILPYPLTFLATDLMSEIYGKARANLCVLIGFFVSLFVLGYVELGASTKAIRVHGWYLPESQERVESLSVVSEGKTLFQARIQGTGEKDPVPLWNQTFAKNNNKTLHASWVDLWRDDLLEKTGAKRIRIDNLTFPKGSQLVLGMAETMPKVHIPEIQLPASPVSDDLFKLVFGGTFRAILASMIAYLLAQWFDIQLFHFWKRLTKGKHLWLRNNGSTILSQLVDTSLVVTVLFLGTQNQPLIPGMIIDGWKFKVLVALVDTPFFYLGVWAFKKYRLAPPWSEYSK
jgi:uncharacterized PurR-regulated membrane protein YhhQ (DUF165 family)